MEKRWTRDRVIFIKTMQINCCFRNICIALFALCPHLRTSFTSFLGRYATHVQRMQIFKVNTLEVIRDAQCTRIQNKSELFQFSMPEHGSLTKFLPHVSKYWSKNSQPGTKNPKQNTEKEKLLPVAGILTLLTTRRRSLWFYTTCDICCVPGFDNSKYFRSSFRSLGRCFSADFPFNRELLKLDRVNACIVEVKGAHAHVIVSYEANYTNLIIKWSGVVVINYLIKLLLLQIQFHCYEILLVEYL